MAREVGASEETVAVTNGPDLHHHLGLGLDPVLIDAIAHYKDFLFHWGFLADDFDLNAWADHRGFVA